MAESPIKYDLTGSCRVTCITEDAKDEPWSVYVPSRLLWSQAGMAELFRICRLQLADPADYPNDNKILEAWEAFHVVNIQECDEFVLDIDWEGSE
jgi:hypothetical protein